MTAMAARGYHGRRRWVGLVWMVMVSGRYDRAWVSRSLAMGRLVGIVIRSGVYGRAWV